MGSNSKGREAGPGFPSFIEDRPVGYFDKPCSIMQRLPYQSETGGISGMWLEGREGIMVERMRGMTPERRAWRKQFLQDQILSDREPVFVPELDRDWYHPLRRAYRYPYQKLYEFLEPKIGHDYTQFVKRGFRNWIFLTLALYAGTYVSLFYINDWQYIKRLSIARSKPIIFPGDPGYPYVSTKDGDDYFDLGFKESGFYKTEAEIRAMAVADQKAKEIREARMKKKDYV